MSGPYLGSKLGPRIASLVSQASVATKAQSVSIDVQRAMHIQDTFFRLVGGEIADSIGPVYQAIADQAPAGSWQHQTFTRLAQPKGQGLSIMGTMAGVTGIGAGLAAVMNNALGSEVQAILSREPSGIIDPATAAGAALRQDLTYTQGEAIAARSGLRPDQFAILYALAETPPGLAEIIQLLNRQELDQASAERWLRQAGMTTAGISAVLNLREQILSPADLSNMVVQAVIDQAEGARIARMNGVSAEDFDRLVRVTGLPPGPMDGLAMLRRGIISEQTFRLLVAQGHTKPEYTDALLQMARVVLSPADAAQMVVQNFLSESEGESVAALNGVDARDFRLMVEVHGRPISPTEATELLNRGQLTEQQFAQVIAESDVKTKYTGDLLKLRVKLPSLYEVRQLVANGSIGDQLAIQIVTDQGYSHEIAAGIVAAAHQTKSKGAKDLALGEILTLWESGYLQEPDARQMLAQLGYDDSEVTLLLDTVEARRLRSYLDAAVATIRARYVAHQTTIDQASTALDSLGVPPKARDQALDLWTHQRQANVRTLTEAQIAEAVKKTVIPPDEGVAKLVQLGYSPDDATILIQLTGVAIPPAA